jgi:polysaccharide export outer membrane protein
VSISIEESARGRLTVEGSVRSPGVFPMQGRISLLQAIAMAGGTDKAADEGAIAVFRNTPDGRVVAMFDLKKIRKGKAADPELKGDDIVIVDRHGGRAFLSNVFSALRNIVTFGAFL